MSATPGKTGTLMAGLGMVLDHPRESQGLVRPSGWAHPPAMWQWCSEYTAEAPSTGRRPLTRRCAGDTRTPAPANLSPPQAPAASATDAAQRPVCAPTSQRTLSKGLPRLPRAIPRDAWRGGKAQPRGTPGVDLR
jgi:hypothetical protein